MARLSKAVAPIQAPENKGPNHMPKIDVETLSALADMLDTLPPRQFDLGEWKRETSCGTTACVIGHAIEKGLLPALKLSRDPHYSNRYFVVHETSGGSGFVAVARAFSPNLDCQDAYALFSVPGYNQNEGGGGYTGDPSPKQVAQHIRRFISSNSYWK